MYDGMDNLRQVAALISDIAQVDDISLLDEEEVSYKDAV